MRTDVRACPACGAEISLPSDHPAQLGCFGVDRLLGQSSLWNLYLGHDTDRQDVELKVLAPAFKLNQGHISAFYAAIAQRTALRSPHIRRVLDCGEAEGRHYVALRHIKGMSLGDHMKQAGPLSEEDALAIAVDLANALQHGWSTHAIRHDALKPDNVLINRDGQAVLDLTIVLPVHEDWKASAIAYAQSNPWFTSPELATGNRDLDCRSDIYSLGVLLHYMLAGEPPFADGDSSAILNRHLAAKRPDICELRNDVHAGAGRLIQQMMAPRPGERPEDWEIVTTALDSLLAKSRSGSTRGHRTVVAARPRRRPRRRRQRQNTDMTKVWLSLIIVTALVLLGLLAWAVSNRP